MKYHKVHVIWTRVAEVSEGGEATILCKDPNDLNEIKQKIEQENFKSFVIKARDYSDSEWTFDVLKKDKQKEPPENDNDDDGPAPERA